MTEVTTPAQPDLYAQAAAAIDEGRSVDARDLLRSILAEHLDVDHLNDLAVACHETGDADAAEALLRAALVIGGDRADIQRNLARLAELREQSGDAHAEAQAEEARAASERWREALPPAVTVSPQASVGEYWGARLQQHTLDSYLGITLSKFPEDLRVYEHLLWTQKPEVLVELGSQYGASTLWFRDRLRTLAEYGLVPAPKVITVDIDLSHARVNIANVDPDHASSITLIEGDVCDPGVRAQVGRHIPAGANVMVIEDSAHIEATTRAALELYADLVPAGGFFVVEDGCVDVEALRINPHWVRGVLPALHLWLRTEAGGAFKVRRDLEIYGVTCHPGGFLQRVA